MARAFLLLEDEYVVDWEVDRQEACVVRSRFAEDDWSVWWEEPAARREHPHRGAARLQPRPRRPGASLPQEQVCLCPVKPAPAARQFWRTNATAGRQASAGH